MSKAAVDTFTLAAKVTRDEFYNRVMADYNKFIGDRKPKPTMRDVSALIKHIEKYEDICKYMRGPGKGIPTSWGGPQDTEFKMAWTLVESLKRVATG